MTDPTMENKTPICGHCQRPIHGSHANLRHFGWYVCHQEEECLRILKAEIEAAEQAQKEAEERLDEAYSQRNRARYLQEITENNLYDALKRADQATREVRDKTIEECAKATKDYFTRWRSSGHKDLRQAAAELDTVLRALSDKQPEETPE